MSIELFKLHKNKIEETGINNNNNNVKSSNKELFYETENFVVDSKYILKLAEASQKFEKFPLGSENSLKQVYEYEKLKKTTQHFICYVIKRVLREWFLRIVVSIMHYEKDSSQNKLILLSLTKSYNVYTSTTTAVRPLLKNLYYKKMSDDTANSMKQILEKAIININSFSQTIDDEYLKLAIGPKEWPLGVLMTDIHSRAGREKIQSYNIKSWLTDDVSRGYLHAFKRITEMIINFDIFKF